MIIGWCGGATKLAVARTWAVLREDVTRLLSEGRKVSSRIGYLLVKELSWEILYCTVKVGTRARSAVVVTACIQVQAIRRGDVKNETVSSRHEVS